MRVNSANFLAVTSQLNAANRQKVDNQQTGLESLLVRLEQQRVVSRGKALQSDIAELGRVFKSLRPAFSSQGGNGGASAVSDSITLNTQATAATLISGEAINTQTTDFSPSDPAWSFSSSADPTIGGFYDGSQGTDTLTFSVVQSGVHGASTARVEVRDGANDLLDTITVAGTDPLDTQYALSNGLTVQFSAGVFVITDTFTVDVISGIDRQPDPLAAFDGSSGQSPNFEFGVAVSAGSFTVNGTLINIGANDNIQSVLDTINASVAGVTAAYESSAETIALTQEQTGTGASIVLDNDTSGFLAATKLDIGMLTPGEDSEADSSLSTIDRFAGVVAGNVLINGTAVAVDPVLDTLAGFLTRLQEADTGIAIDLLNGRIFISAAEEFTLDDNGTNMLAALGLESGSYAVSAVGGQSSGLPNARINQIVRQTNRLLDKFGALFETPRHAPAVPELTTLKQTVESIFTAQLGERFGTAGIDTRLDLDRKFGRYARFSDFTLKRAFKRDLDVAVEVYTGKHSRPGLLEQLDTAIDDAVDAIRRPGLLIDTFV